MDRDERRRKFLEEYQQLCHKYRLQWIGVVDLYLDNLDEEQLALDVTE